MGAHKKLPVNLVSDKNPFKVLFKFRILQGYSFTSQYLPLGKSQKTEKKDEFYNLDWIKSVWLREKWDQIVFNVAKNRENTENMLKLS